MATTNKTQLIQSDMTNWLVSWSQPRDGHIDFIDDNNTGLQYPSRREALAALAEARKERPDAYLVRVTYECEDEKVVSMTGVQSAGPSEADEERPPMSSTAIEVEKSWERIRHYLLDAGNQSDRQRLAADNWPIEPNGEIEAMAKAAIDYYMEHVARFGWNADGQPQSEKRYRKTLNAMRAAVQSVEAAHETYHAFPWQQKGKP